MSEFRKLLRQQVAELDARDEKRVADGTHEWIALHDYANTVILAKVGKY